MSDHGRRVALLLLLCASGCTRRLYEGPALPPEHVATIYVGSTVVRAIDGQKRRGGAFDVGQFEVAPGRHRVALVFELPARTMGLKTLPAQHGEGTCVLDFAAVAGKQYYLGNRARGETSSAHWDGAWEAWVRDPTLASEDDVIARCASEPIGTDTATATSPAGTGTAAAPVAVAPVPAGVSEAAVSPPPAPATAALPPAAPPRTAVPVPEAVAAATIRLGEWNLRSLGGNDDHDVARIAAVIDANFDILVATEVVQRAGAHPDYDALLAALGPGWAGVITDAPRPRAPADGAEFSVVFYRRERVRLCAGWTGLRFPSDAGGGNADRFLHEPAFGCFAAGDASAPSVDFLLAAYHAPWADGDAAAVAAEVTRLGDVFAAMQLARPGEEDLIIAGDFHLEPVELAQVTRATDLTRGDGSVLNLLGSRTPSLPDHIIVFDSRATAELVGEAEVLDVRGVAGSNAEFYRTVSDHLPIVIRMRAAGPDDD